jgi:hypothetical protein
MPRPALRRSNAPRGLPPLGWLIVLLTGAMAAVWSAHKLLEQDEIFSLQTDRVGALAEVFRIQRLYPISLEPPPYHVLAHGAMQVFGPTAFALRLPALVGYLLMQVCVYFFVRNLVGWPPGPKPLGTAGMVGGTEAPPYQGRAGAPGVGQDDPVAQRAGLVAMAVPALTWTLYYAAEGRPYGLLLGSFALAVLCWQLAVKPGAVTRGAGIGGRLWPLAGLAAALALTLNVHFYGVLLLVPLGGAELLRSWQRRRLDLGVLGALAAGMATMVLSLPYVRSSGEFKRHYYAGPVSPHMLTQPYRQMLLNYTAFPHAVQTAVACLLVLAAAAVGWGCVRVARRGALAATGPEYLLVLLLVLLPVFAFGLGKLVTHALEVRHSIGAVIGIVTLIALALTPALASRNSFRALMAVLLLGAVAINVERTRASAAESRATLASLTLSPSELAQVAANADPHIYFQNLGEWETASLYEPDPGLRARLVLVYSRAEEMQYEQHDTMYLTATHTQHFSPQPILAYEQLRGTPGEHIFATLHSGWDWTEYAFAAEAQSVQPLGHAFGGDLVKVRFK